MNMPEVISQSEESWLYIILFGIFFLTCTRVKGNFKFAGALLRDIVGVRERENMFDVTMRETSLILFAMLLSACSMGVLLSKGVGLCGGIVLSSAELDLSSAGLDLPTAGVAGMLMPALVCMAIAVAYMGVMWVSYYFVGNVFSDSLHAGLWVRGFTSSMAFGSVVFFPLALVALTYPEYAEITAILGLLMLILVKIVFIVKGFRIFFTESSLWVVFLYYLCSLEIIPLSISFGLACYLLS